MLRNYSLVALGIENDVFEMHRLVHFETRKWLEQRQELERWKETYLAAMADAFASVAYENWKRCRLLFPHAVLVLEYRPINEGFLPLWAGILDNAGWYAAEQGSYNEAEQMNRRVLAGYEQVLGVERPNTLTSVSNLALVLRRQGKYDEAEQMNRRALAAREQVLGAEHPNTLTSISCLAYLFHCQHKFQDASDLYLRASAGYSKTLVLEHPKTQSCSRHYTAMINEWKPRASLTGA